MFFLCFWQLSLTCSTFVIFFVPYNSDNRIIESGCVAWPSLDGIEASALSQRLGRLLALANPPSSDAAASRQSLDQRMRALQLALQKRRHAAKDSRSHHQRPKTRRQALIEAVGAQKAEKVVSLIREIRVLRLRRRDLLDGASLECKQSLVCTREGGCSKNLYTLRTSQDGKLCKQVKDIFFNTPLLDALEKSPLEQFGQLPWDAMYDQGLKHVQAYRDFLNSEKVVLADLTSSR